MSETQRKAVIAGAGIAGLATGIALRRAGFEVEIYERSPELREIGAGLMIWPNGARSLHALEVDVEGLPLEQLRICTWRGRTSSHYRLAWVKERFGFGPNFVHRADLQRALARSFGDAGLHLGAEVIGFRQDEANVQVAFRDGSTVTGDLLIGADGLRSAVRRQLLGDGDPVYLGSTIWRGVAPSDGLRLGLGDGMNWVGRGAEFLAFHLRNGQIYWAGVTKEPRGEKPGSGGHKDDLMRRFGDWVDLVPALITATAETDILRNDMYDRKPSPRWSEGRVTLVGDAAHPMTPNAGQGACQALEDAVAVGEALEQTPDLTQAFALYERRRLRKANRLVSMSRQATRAVQLENSLLCALRDGFGGVVAELIFPRTLQWMLAPDGPQRTT